MFTTLEEFIMNLEDMGSAMTDDQFMIHMLNNLTSDFELQMVHLEKVIGNIENPLNSTNYVRNCLYDSKDCQCNLILAVKVEQMKSRL
jgi:hypothetical protein